MVYTVVLRRVGSFPCIVDVDPAVNVGFAVEIPEHPQSLDLLHVAGTVISEVLPLGVREMEILEAPGLHQPHGFLSTHMPKVRGKESWSQWSGLNRRPTVYETAHTFRNVQKAQQICAL